MKKMRTDRVSKTTLFRFICNSVYGVCHIIFGTATHSWWFFTIGVYYVILSVIRITVLQSRAKEHFAIRFTAIMLMLLSLPLAGTVILSFTKERGTKYHLIIMLTIALYAFTKLTLASINSIKSRKSAQAKMIALRCISFADAFVSIFSLQRSMLASFDGMTENEIRIMNAATGSVVCIIVFLLGASLISQKSKQS